MLRTLTLLGALAMAAACGDDSDPSGAGPNDDDETLRVETVASNFDTIWELAWGPDGHIWVTERGGEISRVNPGTGAVTSLGQVPDVAEFGEGGLMGLAFHPDFATQPFVYVVHTYSSGGTRNRLVRMRYTGTALGTPEILLDNVPGASIHDGSRLAVGADRLLYMTTGDAANEPLSQDRNSVAGKVLRLGLDGSAAPGNPFGTRVYSVGHRNPQGIAFAPNGTLYISEHGPGDNDEVNRLQAGRNFGWPNVRGFCDGDAGGSEQSFCQANNVVEPLAAWSPTIATAGLAYYDHTLIPGWRGSLLLGTLKDETLYRLVLSSDGARITTQETLFRGQYGRLRAVLVGPDGVVYVGTSNRDGRGSARSGDDRILRIRP
jgi:glucose/arabinose dehydrogenase